MRLADAHGSLLRLRQERSRKLFMGSGCACHHARLRGDDDDVRPLHLLGVASVLAVISALQIYIKWNTGEDGIVKSILMLFGACMFIIGASIVFPAFFGYRI